MIGHLVTIEGGEGVGKTTQLRRLAEELTARGVSVLCTREPGGTPGAELLRRLLLEQDHGLSLRAETMLHFAARFDHVQKTIRPALEAGKLVLCDRFSDSTLAYQGYGLARGDPELINFISQLTALLDMRPELTLILDTSVEERSRRLRLRGMSVDRYESLDEAFHERVAEGFRQIAREASKRCVLVSAQGSIEAVQQQLIAAIHPLLGA